MSSESYFQRNWRSVPRRSDVANRRRRASLAATVIGLAIASLLATATGSANATGSAANGSPTSSGGFHAAVTFIGDSVTAGFGYCGIAENAPHVKCRPNVKMANSWHFGNNSLDDCKPPRRPAPPNDACSNDNDNGHPWDAPPWAQGPGAPRVAYPYQIAASQSATGPARVADWAVSGSTPANWDPAGGLYARQLGELNDQYVVMTLGANPILSYFTNVKFPLTKYDITGQCVYSTGYEEHSHWYSGPFSNVVDCLDRYWDRNHQTQHLEDIYRQLLRQHDRVVVLLYYEGCSWSFGNWQPFANVFAGPSSGNSCVSQHRRESPGSRVRVTQWEQAEVVAAAVNDRILDAIGNVQTWAEHEWPARGREDLAIAMPDQIAWADHQPVASTDPWVILNDTWIHPNKAGAAQLARTVTETMCDSFHHWCGSPPAWG